jgi:hypothetical protein
MYIYVCVYMYIYIYMYMYVLFKLFEVKLSRNAIIIWKAWYMSVMYICGDP